MAYSDTSAENEEMRSPEKHLVVTDTADFFTLLADPTISVANIATLMDGMVLVSCTTSEAPTNVIQ